MKYVGSKRRVAKYILPIILKDRKPGQCYVEPFCGGCNTLSEVTGWRKGFDSHYYLAELWQAVSYGWKPPKKFTEEEYNHIKKYQTKYSSELVGYVGFALSYGSKWFGGWRRDSQGKRDYVDEAYRNALKQFPKLYGVEFHCLSFSELKEDYNFPSGSIIYCDPPYKNTLGSKNFNHEKFWDWCRLMSKNNSIFVSEYEAPDDFECVWKKEMYNTLDQNTGAKSGIEKLFVYKG